MSWFEIAVVCSIVFGIYYIQQIKIALKERGEPVEVFSGWLRDYRRIKRLAAGEEKNERARVRYSTLINGLHLSMGFFALMIVLRVLARFDRCIDRFVPLFYIGRFRSNFMTK